MKIRIKKPFRYQLNAQKEAELAPGVYTAPDDISMDLAGKAIRFGGAQVVVEKKAPENKLAKVPENKAKVVGKPLRSRRTRAKSDD